MSSVETSARNKGELGNLIPSIHLMQFRLVSCGDTTHTGRQACTALYNINVLFSSTASSRISPLFFDAHTQAHAEQVGGLGRAMQSQ